jgi:hypothetical protein
VGTEDKRREEKTRKGKRRKEKRMEGKKEKEEKAAYSGT